MPLNTAIRRAATETLTIPTLRILSSAANEKERIAFVKQHIRAIEMCGRRTIQHAWLVGRELAYIKEQRADLRGRAWVAFTKKHFDLGEIQSFNLMRVSKGCPLLKSLPSGIESVRGAIAALQVRKEIERAEGRTAENRTLATHRRGAPMSGKRRHTVHLRRCPPRHERATSCEPLNSNWRRSPLPTQPRSQRCVRSSSSTTLGYKHLQDERHPRNAERIPASAE